MTKLQMPRKKLPMTTSINIRMTEEERQRIQTLADRAEMRLTTYARAALLEVVDYFHAKEVPPSIADN